MGGINNQYIFDTNQLILMVPTLFRAQQFLLNTFFPAESMSDTEFVSIDVEIGKRRMAPFCSPMVEGKMVESLRYQTNIFKPPYIKDKRAPDLRKPIRRMIGERIGGTLSGTEREQANLTYELEDQVQMIDRRLEWMAAQAMLGGSVTLSGEGFPTTLIDFGRSTTLTVVLAGNDRWGIPANYNPAGKDPVPTQTIETMQYRVLKKSGAVVTDIVFTTTPFTLFLNSILAEGAIKFPVLNPSGNILNPGAQIQRGAVLKGQWGQYRLWVYNDWYVDDNNVEQMMIPDGWIVAGGPDLMGIRAFAQILDPDFNYEALKYAPKTWTKKDPAQRIMLMQSSPIVIPSRPDASYAVKVCDGVVN